MDKPGGSRPPGREHWQQFAACLSADPELFFPISDAGPSLRQADQAKAICAHCPVGRTWRPESGNGSRHDST